ncbi:hypothetical protein DFP73DRAFT_552898 [Morchella snyderi]|nr:hypothetical protein DFP73DRAFT_552898 [Morchella snyderi]
MSASLLLRSSIAARSSAALLPRTTSVAALRAMSDHSTSTRHGNDPEVLQKGKESVLRKHSKDSTEEPHWHEELASDAEAFVKAQRNEINGKVHEEISELQKRTTQKLKRDDQ